jgi:hypothetical protein
MISLCAARKIGSRMSLMMIDDGDESKKRTQLSSRFSRL